MNAQEKGLPAPHSADCRVDFLDVKAAILNRLDGAGDLHQLACGCSGSATGRSVAYSLIAGFHPSWLEVRPNVGTPMAANLTGELRLKVGQAHMIRLAFRVNHDRMRALVVAAVDKKPARAAGRPHFPRVIFCSRCISCSCGSAGTRSHHPVARCLWPRLKRRYSY